MRQRKFEQRGKGGKREEAAELTDFSGLHVHRSDSMVRNTKAFDGITFYTVLTVVPHIKKIFIP